MTELNAKLQSHVKENSNSEENRAEEEPAITPEMMPPDFVQEHLSTDPTLSDLNPQQVGVIGASFFSMMNKAADKNQSTAMEAEAEEEVVEAAEADVIAVSTTEVKMTKVVIKKTKQRERERRKANFGAPMALADALSNVARKGEAVGEDPVAKLAKKTAGDKSLAVQEESLQQE